MKAKAVSVIGGADGPTSFFVAGLPSKKKTFKERARQRIYQYRRKRAEKRIIADPHTLKEVLAYVKKKYHAAEIPKTKRKYAEHYESAKEGLILKHKPELLGAAAKIVRPAVLDERSAKEMYRQIQLLSEMAAKVPDHEMPMDFHIYEIRIAGGRMEMEIDFIWGILGISYSGNKKAMKKLEKLARELYLYYGVSGEDIKNKTERYSVLAAMLSSR